ncbi:MAG: phosphopyruvate hydratase [Candidatus Woesearchaeota archaeon]
MIIQNIHARQVFDSRGNPTVEVELITQQGVFRSIVPSGASTGKHEAHELRDGKKAYLGKGVLQAVKNVNTVIKKEFCGDDCTNQKAIDRKLCKLDGTKNKKKLGANAILGVSMAVAKAGAAAKELPLYKYIGQLAGTKKICLPVPCMNIINGGEHADNSLDVQEFMIIPTGATSFSQAMKMGTEVYHILKNIIKQQFGAGATGVGDEGGFAPNVQSTEHAIALIETAIQTAGYTGKIRIGLDAAASEFYSRKKYAYQGKTITGEQLAKEYSVLAKKHSIISIEDPFDQDDFVHHSQLVKNMKAHCQIVGDDLLVTNVSRMKLAHKKKACTALLLKINQIGTISQAIDAAKLAQSYKWNVMVSHRSGETEDTFIADLVVGLGVGQLKSGAPCRSERMAKYNQLLRIEEELKKQAVYPGLSAFNNAKRA